MKSVAAFIVAIATAGVLVSASVSAQLVDPEQIFPMVPDPCDFITGGGFIMTTPLYPASVNFGATTTEASKANFGVHGGCKHGDFWGHLNYVDHGGYKGARPYHVRSIDITGYFTDPAPNARNICGVAKTNLGEVVEFRVRLEDNVEPVPDTFGIQLANGYTQPPTPLAGGNIQLHKPNKSGEPIPQPAQGLVCPGLEGAPPE
jgi:hypothetical protein